MTRKGKDEKGRMKNREKVEQEEQVEQVAGGAGGSRSRRRAGAARCCD